MKTEWLAFAVSNFDFRRLALNWARALEAIGINNYIIHCIDKKCKDYMDENKANSVFDPINRNKGFNLQLTTKRYKIVADYLHNGIPVVYSDVDAIWLEPPYVNLTGADLYVSTCKHKTAAPKDIMREWGCTICSGWLAFMPQSLELVQSFVQNHKKYQARSKHYCDQSMLNRFLFENPKDFSKSEDYEFCFTEGRFDQRVIGLPQSVVNRASVNNFKCDKLSFDQRMNYMIDLDWFNLGKVCHPRLSDHYHKQSSVAKKREAFFKKNDIWFVD